MLILNCNALNSLSSCILVQGKAQTCLKKTKKIAVIGVLALGVIAGLYYFIKSRCWLKLKQNKAEKALIDTAPITLVSNSTIFKSSPKQEKTKPIIEVTENKIIESKNIEILNTLSPEKGVPTYSFIPKIFHDVKSEDFSVQAYLEKNKEEFLSSGPLTQISSTFESEPFSEPRPLHSLLIPHLLFSDKTEILKKRNEVFHLLLHQSDWLVKRVGIQVNGKIIDAFILGKKDQLHNGRWCLHSNGINNFAEASIQFALNEPMFSKLDTNMIFFNYPGVGDSEGCGTCQEISTSYRAVLSFIEDDKNGLGAKQIIGWGTSFGGGVQGEALIDHPLKDGIDYVFVKDQTFSKLSKTISLHPEFSHVFQETLSKLGMNSTSFDLPKNIEKSIDAMGWSLNSKISSLALKVPEIIIQKASNLNPTKSSEILNDGMISEKGSLAKSLLKKTSHPYPKSYVGIANHHCTGFHDDERKKIIDLILKNFNKHN